MPGRKARLTSIANPLGEIDEGHQARDCTHMVIFYLIQGRAGRSHQGVPVHIVAARLGDDPGVVLATYAHLLPQSDEQAAERVAPLRDAPSARGVLRD
jgi:hypothetical protein